MIDSPSRLPGRAALALVLLCGCATSPSPSPARPTAPVRFTDTVWKVRASTAVAPGTLYVFLSEGTLVITSRGDKPLVGRWEPREGGLTMVEESIPYQVDILGLSHDELRLRSHNPGEPVDLTLVPSEGGPPAP